MRIYIYNAENQKSCRSGLAEKVPGELQLLERPAHAGLLRSAVEETPLAEQSEFPFYPWAPKNTAHAPSAREDLLSQANLCARPSKDEESWTVVDFGRAPFETPRVSGKNGGS